MSEPDLGQFCRAIETHLCQVNQGHLVRIVGPAFDLVKRWHADGVPLKIILRGIERRASRASRVASGARRPLRVEFCEADVMDVLDEWRRAIGFALQGASGTEPAADSPSRDDGSQATSADHEPQASAAESVSSLPKHLERVATRLTSFLASFSDASPALRERVAAALDGVEQLRSAGRLRGDARRAAVEQLTTLDEALLAAIMSDAPAGWLDEARAEARGDLAAYAGRMPAAEFSRLVDRAAQRLLRARLLLPEMRLS